MKCAAVILTGLLSFLSAAGWAQDATSAAALRAQREEAEERFRLLNHKLESVIETQDLLQRNHDKLTQRLQALAGDLEELRRSQGQAGANVVTRDQLKDLVEKVNEIDRKRAADKELILKTFKDLQRLPAPPSVGQHEPRGSSSTGGGAGSGSSAVDPADTYEYVVKEGELLSEIVAAYNAEYKKKGLGTIRLDQVVAANPGLRPDRIYAGKKILIPKPAKR
jgi:TolA-binding protein